MQSKMFRRKMGISQLDKTMKKVVETLYNGGIASTIVGGVALQEHGYLRATMDVDVIVPSIEEANSYLSIRGFKTTGAKSILYDRDNEVEVNLLEGGQPATKNSPLPIPHVGHEPTDKPSIIPLSDLIEMKLNVYLGDNLRYLKHKSDVIELIRSNNLGKNFFKSNNEIIQREWDSILEGLKEDELTS